MSAVDACSIVGRIVADKLQHYEPRHDGEVGVSLGVTMRVSCSYVVRDLVHVPTKFCGQLHVLDKCITGRAIILGQQNLDKATEVGEEAHRQGFGLLEGN